MKLLTKFFLIFLLFFAYFSPYQKIYAAKAEPYWILDQRTAKEQFDKSVEIYNGKEDKSPISYGPVSYFQDQMKLYNIIQMGYCPPKTNRLPGDCNPQMAALNNVTYAMQTLYVNPPADVAYWARDTLASAGLTKPAYAQVGIGYAGLSALLPLWKATRDIAFAAIILVMLAIGFMVIFRMKIDPKTVISVQAALPKIILTLILIYFSYAIVGLLIDAMYIVMAVVVNVIANATPGATSKQIADLQTQYMTGDAGTLWGPIAWSGANSISNLFWSFLKYGTAGAFGLGAIASIPAFAFIGSLGGLAFVTAIPSLFVGAILILGLIFVFIRLFLLLLNSYIQLLISLILGPLILLMEAIPGKSAFGDWIMNIIANLVVFPATAAILMFGLLLTGYGGVTKDADRSLWAPPFLSIPVIGANPVGNSGGFAAFLGLGVILMSPNLVAAIKKAFGPKPALPISPATLLSPLTGGFQTAMGAASQFYYIAQLKTMLPGGGGGQGGHQQRTN